MKNFSSQNFQKAEPALPYQHIAEFYDRLMSHVNYKIWAEYIIECFQKFGNDIHTVLDGGCGTGSLIYELKRRGFRVAGFDLSFPMIRRARSKGLKNVWQGDLCQPAACNGWDGVICLYDTIHYLTETDIQPFFNRLAGMVRPGGIMIFDTVTEHHVRQYWADYTEKGEEGECRYIRRCWYDASVRCQHTEFRISSKKGAQMFREHHRQWIYPFSYLIKQAEYSGFEVRGVFDEFNFEPGDERSDRIHVVLYRREK